MDYKQPPQYDVEAAPEQTEQGIGRHMGLLAGIVMVTGYVIGSGIFAAPGEIIDSAGSIGLSLILWVVAGVIATTGALAYAELGTLFPKNGADQVYLTEAFHPIMGLGFSMSNVLIAASFIQAAMCSIFGQYLYRMVIWDTTKSPNDQPKIDEDDWWPRIIGIIAIVVVACANMIHKKAGTAIQIVFTAGKLLALVIILLIGLVYFAKGEQIGFKTSESIFAETKTDAKEIVIGLSFALFSFTGFNNLNTTAGELKNPARNLPLSIIISMFITGVLYLLANVSYFAVLGAKAVAQSKSVAILVGSESMQLFGVYALAIGVLLSTIGGANGGAVSQSRLIMAAAEEGIWMPRIMGKVSSRGTPIYALMMNIVLSTIIIVAFKDFSILGPVCSFILLTHYLLSNAACIWLRYKRPDAERAFKVPLICPIIFTTVATAVNLVSLFTCSNIFIGIGFGAALASVFLLPAIVYYFRMPAFATSSSAEESKD